MVRITIREAMLAVIGLGLGLAHVRSAPDPWKAATFDLTLAILVVGAFRARFGPRRSQAWWFGFSLLGWAHFLLNEPTDPDRWLYLPTTPILQYLISAYGAWWKSHYASVGPASPDELRISWFRQTIVIEACYSLLVACVGGWLGTLFGRRERAARDD